MSTEEGVKAMRDMIPRIATKVRGRSTEYHLRFGPNEHEVWWEVRLKP